MPHLRYGRLLHSYAVAFAGLLLLRSAPLSDRAPGDERLVSITLSDQEKAAWHDGALVWLNAASPSLGRSALTATDCTNVQQRRM